MKKGKMVQKMVGGLLVLVFGFQFTSTNVLAKIETPKPEIIQVATTLENSFNQFTDNLQVLANLEQFLTDLNQGEIIDDTNKAKIQAQLREYKEKIETALQKLETLYQSGGWVFGDELYQTLTNFYKELINILDTLIVALETETDPQVIREAVLEALRDAQAVRFAAQSYIFGSLYDSVKTFRASIDEFMKKQYFDRSLGYAKVTVDTPLRNIYGYIVNHLREEKRNTAVINDLAKANQEFTLYIEAAQRDLRYAQRKLELAKREKNAQKAIDTGLKAGNDFGSGLYLLYQAGLVIDQKTIPTVDALAKEVASYVKLTDANTFHWAGVSVALAATSMEYKIVRTILDEINSLLKECVNSEDPLKCVEERI